MGYFDRHTAASDQSIKTNRRLSHHIANLQRQSPLPRRRQNVGQPFDLIMIPSPRQDIMIIKLIRFDGTSLNSIRAAASCRPRRSFAPSQARTHVCFLRTNIPHRFFCISVSLSSVFIHLLAHLPGYHNHVPGGCFPLPFTHWQSLGRKLNLLPEWFYGVCLVAGQLDSMWPVWWYIIDIIVD